MKVYPKVPRFDHPTVEDEFFESDDLVILEKVDGSNLRFAMYDSEYEDYYDLQGVDADDGDIVIGTKRKIRGKLSDPVEEFDGNLRRAVKYLKQRQGVSESKLRGLHRSYESPLVFYAENMVFHTLNYNYDSSPPPAVLGFDIYLPDRDTRDDIPDDPFEERFEGFVDYKTMEELFGYLGLDVTPELDRTFDELLEGRFPESNFAEGVTVEGAVLRSDSRRRRVKIVREEFHELNREAFGLREGQAESGEEVIAARYCTNARIRKIVRKMVVDEGKEFGLHLNEELHNRVYDDMWEENWHEIKEANVEFTPSEIRPIVAKRCIETLKRMKANAELNDADPHELWQDIT